MKGSTRRYGVYLALALLIPLSYFVGILLLAGSNWFSLHDQYPPMRNTGYGVRAKGLNCQIVLYGDSSALTGLDPAIVTRFTGLTACNVSEGLTIQMVSGSDGPLRAYLSQNKTPRIIVGMWSYTQVRPDMPPFTRYTTEGMIYSSRYLGHLAFLHGIFLHPEWTTRFVSWATEILRLDFFEALDGTRVRHPDAQTQRAERGGLYPFPFGPETSCIRNAMQEGSDAIRAWPESVAAFRSKYTTPETPVLLDISPIPDCNKYLSIYKKRNEGLHDNPLLVVPIRFFNEGDVHFSPEGSRFISEQVAHQVREALHLGAPE